MASLLIGSERFHGAGKMLVNKLIDMRGMFSCFLHLLFLLISNSPCSPTGHDATVPLECVRRALLKLHSNCALVRLFLLARYLLDTKSSSIWAEAVTPLDT